MAIEMKKDIRTLSLDEIEKQLTDLGEKPFRAKQIYEWLWKKSATDFDQMTNLSLGLRDLLSEKFTMPTAEETAIDQTLIARFREGDSSAFEEMVDRYYDRIYNRVHQMLKNQQDAEEVTQDAFIRAHKGLETFRGDASFSTWLYQIATNLAHNKYWYWFRRKRAQSFSIDQTVGDDGDLTVAELLPSEEAAPSQNTLNLELVEKIEEAMLLLTPSHREILEMRNRQGLSYDEIADELNLSVGTVKSRIARARTQLREKMGKDFQ